MAVDWLAEHLRFSLFLKDAASIKEADWCILTKTEEADARLNIPGGRVFSGAFETGVLNLSGAFNRIDVVYAPNPSSEPPSEPQFHSVGPWLANRDRLLDLMIEWVTHLDLPIIRIAFGSVLFCETPDRETSYKILADLIPSVRINAAQMQEFLFRVNRPTNSKIIQDLTINRITSWSAILISQAQFSPTGGTELSANNLHGVRVELDNSTDATNSSSFTKVQISALLDELVSLASETALEGDSK